MTQWVNEWVSEWVGKWKGSFFLSMSHRLMGRDGWLRRRISQADHFDCGWSCYNGWIWQIGNTPQQHHHNSHIQTSTSLACRSNARFFAAHSIQTGLHHISVKPVIKSPLYWWLYSIPSEKPTQTNKPTRNSDDHNFSSMRLSLLDPRPLLTHNHRTRCGRNRIDVPEIRI